MVLLYIFLLLWQRREAGKGDMEEERKSRSIKLNHSIDSLKDCTAQILAQAAALAKASVVCMRGDLLGSGGVSTMRTSGGDGDGVCLPSSCRLEGVLCLSWPHQPWFLCLSPSCIGFLVLVSKLDYWSSLRTVV